MDSNLQGLIGFFFPVFIPLPRVRPPRKNCSEQTDEHWFISELGIQLRAPGLSCLPPSSWGNWYLLNLTLGWLTCDPTTRRRIWTSFRSVIDPVWAEDGCVTWTSERENVLLPLVTPESAIIHYWLCPTCLSFEVVLGMWRTDHLYVSLRYQLHWIHWHVWCLLPCPLHHKEKKKKPKPHISRGNNLCWISVLNSVLGGVAM